MKGFFQLQRRFFDHWLWTGEPRVFSKAEAFLDLLQLAAFTRTKKIVGSSVIVIEPGQVCGSERYLAGRWGWSTKKVRNFLTLLEADRMAERQKKQGVTVITLCNYAKYASGGSGEEAAKKQEGSTAEAVRKRIEEGEEREKGKEPNPSFAPDGASSDPPPAKGKEIAWNPTDGFIGITDEDTRAWAEAFPALDIRSQIARAHQWLLANPAKRKKAVRRFLVNWFSRSQERGGDRATPTSPHAPPNHHLGYRTSSRVNAADLPDLPEDEFNAQKDIPF